VAGDSFILSSFFSVLKKDKDGRRVGTSPARKRCGGVTFTVFELLGLSSPILPHMLVRITLINSLKSLIYFSPEIIFKKLMILSVFCMAGSRLGCGTLSFAQHEGLWETGSAPMVRDQTF